MCALFCPKGSLLFKSEGGGQQVGGKRLGAPFHWFCSGWPRHASSTGESMNPYFPKGHGLTISIQQFIHTHTNTHILTCTFERQSRLPSMQWHKDNGAPVPHAISPSGSLSSKSIAFTSLIVSWGMAKKYLDAHMHTHIHT